MRSVSIFYFSVVAVILAIDFVVVAKLLAILGPIAVASEVALVLFR